MFFKEIEIKEEQSASFSGGGPFHIDKLKVKKGAVLKLGAGTYFVNKFDMKDDDARIKLLSTPVVLQIGEDVQSGSETTDPQRRGVGGRLARLFA